MMDASRTKLPKRIAGVKLPKKLRKKANRMIGALDQPLVRNLASVALAAASAAAVKTSEDAGDAAVGTAKTTGRSTPPGDATAAHNKLADVAIGLTLAAITTWLSAKKPDTPEKA